MLKKLAPVFLFLATLFVAAHYFANLTSLYWYLWWFDMVMHFSGGLLITLGLYTVCAFRRFNCNPALKMVLIILALVTVTWELFELLTNMRQPEAYLLDTVYDITIGFIGGLLAYFILRKYTIER